MSIRWKIYSIALVSVIAFGAYLAFNLWVNSSNAKLLAQAKDVYYPILEKANENSVRLDRVDELHTTGVLTGEQDYIESAENTARKLVDGFRAIAELEVERKDDIHRIIEAFDSYYEAANVIAREMLQEDIDFKVVKERAGEKEKYLDQVTQLTEEYITYANDSFKHKIEVVNENNDDLLNYGVLIWVVSMILLSFVVHTIASIILKKIDDVSSSIREIVAGGEKETKEVLVTSNDEIGELAKNFNQLLANIREKTNDLMALMHNMHQGLFTITRDGVIHKEYAHYLEEIFSTNSVAGKPYGDLLFAKCDIGVDGRDQAESAVNMLLASEKMMWDFNSHLLPKSYSISEPDNPECKKALELDWDPIIADGVVDKVMVTVRDVTELRLIQEKTRKQEQELSIIGEVLQATPQKFKAFSANAKELLAKNEALVSATEGWDNEVVRTLFANMHTIKGNARTYGFEQITNLVHRAESTYDKLRTSSEPVWNQSHLLDEIATVKAVIASYDRLVEEKLSSLSASKSNAQAEAIELTRPLFNNLIDRLRGFCSGDEGRHIKTLYNEVVSCGTMDLASLLQGQILSLPSVAQQLEKPAPNVHIEADEVRIFNQFDDVLNNVFMHLFRNALDHGIEPPLERLEKQKPESGSIYLKARRQANGAVVTVSDDGRGLNLNAIRQKADKQGVLQAGQEIEAQDLAELIFSPYLSTAGQVTDISGRGVGMDAVRSMLKEQGADIAIELKHSSKGADTLPANVGTPFEFVISLPDSVVVNLQ